MDIYRLVHILTICDPLRFALGDHADMLTSSARRAESIATDHRVRSRAELSRSGFDDHRVAAQLAANRWQRCGRAIVMHNGPLTRYQRWMSALITVGPRSIFTAFTAAELLGLKGWERESIHVLAPAGVGYPVVPALRIRLHRTGSWPSVERHPLHPAQGLGPALLVAGSTFTGPRPACGMLAAAVQQRLLRSEELLRALQAAQRVRHRATMLAAVRDIAGGSQALSEIDFVRLCRAHGLPEPIRQAVRVDSTGRRRYLDASWRRRDGRLIVAEVDGALHLSLRRWWDDQLRQNELMLAGSLVLRFPSVVVRTEPGVVAAQLRRALWL